MRFLVPLLFLQSVAFATDPAPTPTPKPIRFPTAPPTPVQPVVPPGTATKLDGSALFVIDCSVECAIRVYPQGLVTVKKKKKGPRDITGVFADGNGTSEDRTYDGPFIYQVEAVAGQKGQIVIDAIPFGFKTEADIKSATVDVNGGKGPQPPPVDPITPVTPLTALEQKLKTAMTADTATKAELTLYVKFYATLAAKTVDDTTITTCGALLTEFQNAFKNLNITPGALDKTRRAAADEFDSVVKTRPNDPLDAPTRARVKAELGAIAAALQNAAK